MAPLVPRSRFGTATCRRSRRSSTGRCRTGRASTGCISNGSHAHPIIAGEHLLIAGSDKHNYGHYLHDIVPLIDLGAQNGRAHADLDAEAMAAGADRPARRPAGPDPRDQAAAGLSRTCDHQQQVHRPQQPERASAEPRSVRAHPRRTCESTRRRSSTPPRVLICRSPSNSRNITNRAAMIEALKPLGFAAIQPDKLKFDEQALLFARPRSSSASSAPRLSNAYFCRAGDEDRRDHRRGSARPMVLAFLRHARARTRRPVPAPVRRGRWRACPGIEGSPFSYAVDVPKLVETVKALV